MANSLSKEKKLIFDENHFQLQDTPDLSLNKFMGVQLLSKPKTLSRMQNLFWIL